MQGLPNMPLFARDYTKYSHNFQSRQSSVHDLLCERRIKEDRGARGRYRFHFQIQWFTPFPGYVRPYQRGFLIPF